MKNTTGAIGSKRTYSITELINAEITKNLNEIKDLTGPKSKEMVTLKCAGDVVAGAGKCLLDMIPGANIPVEIVDTTISIFSRIKNYQKDKKKFDQINAKLNNIMQLIALMQANPEMTQKLALQDYKLLTKEERRKLFTKEQRKTLKGIGTKRKTSNIARAY